MSKSRRHRVAVVAVTFVLVGLCCLPAMGLPVRNPTNGNYYEPVSTPGIDHVVKVLVVDFDPVLESRGGKRLHQYACWNDPHTLATQFNDKLRAATGNHVTHQVVDWVELDEWPQRADGFRFTDASWLSIYEQTPRNWPAIPPGSSGYLDYQGILDRFHVAERVQRDEIDQVWIFGYHFMGSGFFESCMAGRGAYWCNGPVVGSYDCEPFITYYFNYERGVDCMLENMGHAMENIMSHTYGRWNCSVPIEQMNTWERFTVYDKVSPGNAACGNVHYAPNSNSDYDWGNTRVVRTTYANWSSYPNLAGQAVNANCSAWGNGSQEAHHLWWFNLMPHVSGVDASGVMNDWWMYYVRPTGLPGAFTARACTANVTAIGGSEQVFTVEYLSPSPVDPSSFGDGDLLVHGPGGFVGTVRLQGVGGAQPALQRVATYALTPPGGTWNSADSGHYTIEAQANRVRNTQGQALPAGVIGEFWVGKPVRSDLTDDASIAWTGWADSATGTAAADSSRVLSGTRSIRFDTNGGFDTALICTPVQPWDLSNVSTLGISFYADNSNIGFQNGSPWIILFDAQGRSVRYQYYSGASPYDLLHDAIGRWVTCAIPLDPRDSAWHKTTGGADMAHIARMEIHADTWDYGFTIWVDNVFFERWTALRIGGDTNGDGYVNVGDLQLLVAAWGSGPNCTGSADLNDDRYVNIGDLQVLVANWGMSSN